MHTHNVNAFRHLFSLISTSFGISLHSSTRDYSLNVVGILESNLNVNNILVTLKQTSSFSVAFELALNTLSMSNIR